MTDYLIEIREHARDRMHAEHCMDDASAARYDAARDEFERLGGRISTEPRYEIDLGSLGD